MVVAVSEIPERPARHRRAPTAPNLQFSISGPTPPPPAASPSEDENGGVSRRGFSSGTGVSQFQRAPASDLLPPTSVFRVVGIAASTGGPAALQAVLAPLPADFPVPVLVVQHMPRGFTSPLARRLDQFCALRVEEGRDGEEVRPGRVLIAPAGKQMQVVPAGDRVLLSISATTPLPTVLYPSADVLFASMAAVYGAGSLAVVLTGMGRDGAVGLRRIKEEGGWVLAQDASSSVVFGMPRAAIEEGLADAVLPLSVMAAEIIRLVGS